MKDACFNCALCSEHYPSFTDTCDKDNHLIHDVFSETCDIFWEADE